MHDARTFGIVDEITSEHSKRVWVTSEIGKQRLIGATNQVRSETGSDQRCPLEFLFIPPGCPGADHISNFALLIHRILKIRADGERKV